jgi:hypothetical protein
MALKISTVLAVLMLTSIALAWTPATDPNAYWYPPPSNTSGIQGIINSTSQGMEKQIGGVGGNLIGISILLPLWVIIFLPLAKFNVEAAWTLTNFICWLVSSFMILLGMIHEVAFLIFGIAWVMGAVGYYLHTRN